ncbi:MAG: CDC27 family protein [Crocinitomicaceae bacterium]|nr:CDC27 family protein [Crocinitomicaceae bacterium]
MNQNKEHIDLKRIQDYFNGKLSPKEKHALEMEAQSDPFLYEAMEGYEAHPEGLEQLAKLKKAHAKNSRSFFGSGTLTILGMAGLVYVIALIIKPDIEEPNIQPLTGTEDNFKEVENLPEAIDTLVFAEDKEQITPQELVENRPFLEASNEELAAQLEQEEEENLGNANEVIHVEEIKITEEDHQIIPEEELRKKSRNAPFIYQYDLKVVDYREIDRTNNVIQYTRYEFSGVSANFEDEEAMEKQYDRELEVEVPYMDYLDRSMYYFSKGQYKQALNRYLTILEQYPKDLNASFYGALCYYDMKKYNEALDFLSNMLEFESETGYIAFRQEAKWYQAKTLIKLNQKEKAIKILDEIIAEGLFYTEDAIQLKKSL